LKFIGRTVTLTFRTASWLTAAEPGEVLVMWHDGQAQILPPAEVLELDAGRSMFKWARLPSRESIWGMVVAGADEIAETAGETR
jgi:hypothetical protein